jgi:hypothetical protein
MLRDRLRVIVNAKIIKFQIIVISVYAVSEGYYNELVRIANNNDIVDFGIIYTENEALLYDKRKVISMRNARHSFYL